MPTVLVAQRCHVAVEFSTRTFLQSEFQDSNQDGQISREEYSPEENACGHLTFFLFCLLFELDLLSSPRFAAAMGQAGQTGQPATLPGAMGPCCNGL